MKTCLILKKLIRCLFLATFLLISVKPCHNTTNSVDTLENVDDSLFVDLGKEQNNDSFISPDLTDWCKEFIIDIAQICAIEFFISSISTIAHESGHAIAAKSLFDVYDPIQIHIGTINPDSTSKLFSISNMHFYKNIPWKCGLTISRDLGIKTGRESCKNIDLGIKSIAGGMSASILMYLLLSTITGYCAYLDNKGLSEILLKSFINGSSPFFHILDTKNLSCKQKRFLLNVALVACLCLIDQFFYGCTPSRSGDGMKVWKEYIDLTGMPLKISQGLSILGEIGCWAMLIKKYCDARKKLLPASAQISIPVALIASILIHVQIIPSM